MKISAGQHRTAAASSVRQEPHSGSPSAQCGRRRRWYNQSLFKPSSSGTGGDGRASRWANYDDGRASRCDCRWPLNPAILGVASSSGALNGS